MLNKHIWWTCADEFEPLLPIVQQHEAYHVNWKSTHLLLGYTE